MWAEINVLQISPVAGAFASPLLDGVQPHLCAWLRYLRVVKA
jgi:hypothetical protein